MSEQQEQQLQKLEKQWEKLTIADDRMSSMVMENNDICRELLQRIFPELRIRRVQRVADPKAGQYPAGCPDGPL